MHRRLIATTVVSAVFLCLCSTLVFQTRPADPHANGRSYSQWLERLTPSVAPSFLAASNVVRSVGTNGFPLLRAYLRAKDSRARLFFLSKGIGADEFVAASQLQVNACNAVTVMGNDASELMPLITTLLTNKVDSVRLAALRAIAANSLPFPGQDAFLTNLIVTDQILVCRAHAANALLRRGADQNRVVELLASGWTNRLLSEKEMHQFLWVIGQLNLPREQYSRLLVSWAQSPELFTRRFAAHLFLYSEALVRDCPQTVEALSRETNVYVSKPAQEALRKLKSGEPGVR